MRVLNSLDPNENQHCVGPDLGPNCLQRLSVDHSKVRVNFNTCKLILANLHPMVQSDLVPHFGVVTTADTKGDELHR